MRDGLMFLFWVCLLGTFFQAPLLGYEFWLLATQATTFGELTVVVLLTEHLTFFAWIASLILGVFGPVFGGWILSLPVILVTSVKLICGSLIGYWSLVTVRKMDSSRAPGQAVESVG